MHCGSDGGESGDWNLHVVEAGDQLLYSFLYVSRCLAVDMQAVEVLWPVDGAQQTHYLIHILVKRYAANKTSVGVHALAYRPWTTSPSLDCVT